MRCGVREKEPHTTGHSNFCFSARTHSLPSCICAIIRRKKERPPSTTTRLCNPCVSSSRKNVTLKTQRCHRLWKPLSAAVPRTGECTSRIRRPLPELSYPASRVEAWNAFALLQGHADGSVAPSASFEPPSFEAPADRTNKASKALPRPTGPVDRHPSAVLPGSTNEWRVQKSLGRGNRANVLFPQVPANLEPRQTVEPLETDMVSMGAMGSHPWWPGFSLPTVLDGGLKGGVVGCQHPGRSQKPHEKRRNCLPHAPMLSRRLVAGARPRSRQMAGMCVGTRPWKPATPLPPTFTPLRGSRLDAT
jgi:hypothetical protein